MRPNTVILLALVFTLTLGGAACAGKSVKPNETAPATQSVVPLVGDFKVHRYSLSNGLRLLVVEDHSSPTLAYETWFRVGSRDEVVGRTGLAHLFEHMMFKGTKTHKEGEFDRLLEAAGVEGENAFTSRDYTAYVQELPKGQLELIMGLESDRMVNLMVNDQSFKTERDVVQNERRFRNENNPDGLMYQQIFESAFLKHSYHWPVIGFQKDLEAMTAQDARDFYQAYYSPNHATVVVVGDVDPGHVFDLAKKYYGSLVSQPTPAHEVPVEPEQTTARHEKMKLNIQVEKLMMGYRIPGILHPDQPALDVLLAVMAGGKSSRLHRALVETGITTNIDAYDLEDKDPSLFILGANLQKGKKASQAETIILKELARLAKEGPTTKEVESAKNRISFGFFQGLDSNSEKCRFLGHYEAVAGDFTVGLDHYKKTAQVTPEQVQAVAKRYFESKNRIAIVGVNK